MKQFAIVLATLTMAASAFGQGAIFFNNRSIGNVVAPIYGVNPANPLVSLHGNAATNQSTQPAGDSRMVDYAGVPLLFGTGFTAELWGENPATPNVFTPLAGVAAKVQFRTTATLGGFLANSASSILVPWVPGPANGSSRFQVRAWDNGGDINSTYANAVAALRASGVSDIFTSPVIAAPSTPGQIVGFTSFSLSTVPEPGVIALGVLGVGALLLRRRK